MNSTKLLQNAFFVPEDDAYFISTHRHDFVQWTSKDGKASWAVDGGLAYRRNTASSWDLEGTRVIDWSLTTKSRVSEIRKKLLWGTRGKDGKDELTFRPISTFSLDHLRAILKTQSHIKGTIYEKVVKYWIKEKGKKGKKRETSH